MRIGYPGWSLDIPSGWEPQDDSECITITASRDSGALQVSSAIKEISDITDTDLLEFAEDDGFESGTSSSPLGPFTGFTALREHQGLLWHHYWLRHRSLMIFATYIVEPHRKAQEWPAIQHMLGSLRIESVEA